MNWIKENGRLLAGAAVCLCLLAALGLALRPGAAVETGSWGLHFESPGAVPTGPASPETLAQYDGAFLGDPAEKVLYLTFDCGYENGFTGQILDTLKAHGVPAAFFVVGTYVEQNPALVQRMADEGHTVGNHTWHHYDMSRIADRETFRRELAYVEEQYRAATGRELPRYYRPPQGIYSEENLRMAKDLGYRTVFWSLAYVDWEQDRQPTREQALSRLLPRTHPGAVILLHATSETNAAILDELLTRWEEEGYRFAPVEELFPAAVTNESP